MGKAWRDMREGVNGWLHAFHLRTSASLTHLSVHSLHQILDDGVDDRK